MSKRELKKQQERAKKYGCDGRCYWETGMCPAVEVCEENQSRRVHGNRDRRHRGPFDDGNPTNPAGRRHDSADLGDHSDSSRDLEGGK